MSDSRAYRTLRRHTAVHTLGATLHLTKTLSKQTLTRTYAMSNKLTSVSAELLTPATSVRQLQINLTENTPVACI